MHKNQPEHHPALPPPQPPFIFWSIHLQPNSLKISTSRNNTNPIIATHMVCSPEGATSNGIQVPTYSSITTARGSSPQSPSPYLRY